MSNPISLENSSDDDLGSEDDHMTTAQDISVDEGRAELESNDVDLEDNMSSVEETSQRKSVHSPEHAGRDAEDRRDKVHRHKRRRLSKKRHINSQDDSAEDLQEMAADISSAADVEDTDDVDVETEESSKTKEPMAEDDSSSDSFFNSGTESTEGKSQQRATKSSLDSEDETGTEPESDDLQIVETHILPDTQKFLRKRKGARPELARLLELRNARTMRSRRRAKMKNSGANSSSRLNRTTFKVVDLDSDSDNELSDSSHISQDTAVSLFVV